MHHLGKKFLGFLTSIIRTLRLALPKLGVGWMFALLTIDFNRIAIVELGIAAILITAMLSLHYFLSPFQVISGRFADRHPFFGLRRTPYLLLGGVVASLIFIGLPRVVHAIGAGSFSATLAGFGLLILYGVAIAFMGDSHHSLIAEVTEPKSLTRCGHFCGVDVHHFKLHYFGDCFQHCAPGIQPRSDAAFV